MMTLTWVFFWGKIQVIGRYVLESSTATLQADRVMVCHKSARRDPYAEQIYHQYLTTCHWRDAPVYSPEAQLLGVMYVADPVDGDIVVCNTQHWVFEQTGLADGARLTGLLGVRSR